MRRARCGARMRNRSSRAVLVIAGYNTSAAQKSVSLVVNDKAVATKQVSVPANGKATVEFASLEVPYGLNKCEVRIDSGATSGDAMPADDVRRFAVERSDPEKILLVHNYGDNRSPVYITAALSAAAQAAFVVEPINVNEAADRKTSDYGVVILSDLTTVPALLENTLTGYVKAGGAVFIAAGTSAAAHTQIPIFNAHINETHDYTRNPDHYSLVGDTDSSFGAVGKADSWHGVKFYYALSVDPAAAPRDRAAERRLTPVLMEKRIGEGRVVPSRPAPDEPGERFPAAPGFRALHRADHPISRRQRAAGRRAAWSTRSSSFATRDAGARRSGSHRSRRQTAAVAERSRQSAIDPVDRRRLLAVPAWPTATRTLVGVNADPKESNLDVIPDDVMSLWDGQEAAQEAIARRLSTGPAKPQ